MHVPMQEVPLIRAGHAPADIVGGDQRALQAAVDYIANMGGGVVEITPGEYVLRDSLHVRSGVAIRGTAGKTILRKARSAGSALEVDGDFGEEQITLSAPEGFQIGDGVAIWDKNAGGFHTTVARITGRTGNTFRISIPLYADCLVEREAKAATVFPVVSAANSSGVRLEGLTIEGNRDENEFLNGCRGGGIFLLRCPGATIENCTVRRFNGDGISFQQCNDVKVLNCVSESNAGLGLHPGSGSQRPVIRACTARDNGEDGLFLCWRVKFGVFEDNVIEGNRRFGISIGHKDTDNLLAKNTIRSNHQAGVFFRNEAPGMGAHRNRLHDNLIEDNGAAPGSHGIRVRGHTEGLEFRGNTIRDSRPGSNAHQAIGLQLESNVGRVLLETNRIQALRPLVDERKNPDK